LTTYKSRGRSIPVILKKQQVKKFIITAFCFALISGLFAQEAPSKPGYLRFPTLPPFTLIKADSSTLTRNDLAKNRATLFMFFSPDCEHCQVQTDSILANMDKLKDVEILMATYRPIEMMKAFYEERQMEKYANIKMGYDSKYFFPPFYKMGSLPFMALYNKKGQFITSFEGNAGIEKILQAFARKN
jgi:hypothetical protein